MFRSLIQNYKFNKYVDNLKIDSEILEEIDHYIEHVIDLAQKRDEKDIRKDFYEYLSKLEGITPRKIEEPIFYAKSDQPNKFDLIEHDTRYQLMIEGIPPSYSIRILPKVLKKFSKYASNLSKRFNQKLKEISYQANNIGVKKMSGLENCFRARVGDYRIVYKKVDKISTIFILLIAHRKEVYQKL